MSGQSKDEMSRRSFLKTIGAAGAGLTLAQLVSACGGTPAAVSGGATPTSAPAATPTAVKLRTDLRYGSYGEPDTLNPFFAGSSLQGEVCYQVCEPLLHLIFRKCNPLRPWPQTGSKSILSPGSFDYRKEFNGIKDTVK